MPEDNEELALTLSGKKRKLHRKDFENTFCRFGLNQQVTEKIFDDFQAVLPLWIHFIEASFLSDELKEKYIQLIEKKMTVLY
jgi:serine/threonine-protein kinase HipA